MGGYRNLEMQLLTLQLLMGNSEKLGGVLSWCNSLLLADILGGVKKIGENQLV